MFGSNINRVIAAAALGVGLGGSCTPDAELQAMPNVTRTVDGPIFGERFTALNYALTNLGAYRLDANAVFWVEGAPDQDRANKLEIKRINDIQAQLDRAQKALDEYRASYRIEGEGNK